MILPLESDLLPVVTADYWDLISRDEEMQIDERARCANEPWYWLVNYIWTVRKDENVEGGVLERFPPYRYLQYVFHKIFSEPYFAADKSRQVLLSLSLMAYALWKVQYNKHEEIICQTKKEDDGDEQLLRRRAWVMWESQPGYIHEPAFYKKCHILVPSTDSVIKAIPKGADQIRSANPTTVIIDEGGFFEGEFEDCRTAALACCKDVKCVSTPNIGQWDTFINDRMVA